MEAKGSARRWASFRHGGDRGAVAEPEAAVRIVSMVEALGVASRAWLHATLRHGLWRGQPCLMELGGGEQRTTTSWRKAQQRGYSGGAASARS
jgi:hypothetical protein